VNQAITNHHIVIIGGGPGGYQAALAGRQLGANVTLIERDGVGGSAVLTDVVPSKTLIATAAAAEAVKTASALGIKVADGNAHVSVDLASVNKRLLELASSQSKEMTENLQSAGVRIINGTGRLDGNHHVIAEASDGSQIERLEAKTIILAVGARPRTLPGADPDGERIFTWTQLYNLKQLPEHLIVVGSGVTGAEFASAYLSLDCKVTLVSSRDNVLPGEDLDAAVLIEEVFRREGMNIVKNSRADKIEKTANGVKVTLIDGKTIEGSHCLVAVGSIPNTENIGLEDAGVVKAPSGHIIANRVARTSRANVYAVGDCTDFYPLASVAAMQGRTAVFHTMGDVATPTLKRNIASNVFTSPEIASVGWSEGEIKAGLVNGQIETIALATNPRAKMTGVKDGFIKLFSSTGSGTVIGGVVVAPNASELIYPIAMAVENRLSVDELARTYTVYPSLTATITEAARALHNPNLD
jgi:pyruvate/2-oxoglutarate dehydrogenase complex dihydrolipoamide dehydrogenase (E3) component